MEALQSFLAAMEPENSFTIKLEETTVDTGGVSRSSLTSKCSAHAISHTYHMYPEEGNGQEYHQTTIPKPS